jgi:hypothetical protein
MLTYSHCAGFLARDQVRGRHRAAREAAVPRCHQRLES